MNTKTTLATLLVTAIISGCANGFLPRAHRHAMQQGNMIERSSVDRLQVGMNTEQVRYLLGNPVISNIADQDQWLYTFSAGKLVEPGKPQLLLVQFKDGLVANIEDNYDTANSIDAYHANVASDFD